MKIRASLVGLLIVATASRGSSAEVRQFSRLLSGLPIIQQSARDLPVTCQADVVVAGGTISGAVAAIQAAAEGLSVVLVEERNQLGYGPAKNPDAPWEPKGIDNLSPSGTKLLHEIQKESRSSKFVPDRSRAVLHRRVAEQPRIRVFFFSMPVGLVVDRRQVGGLVVANRAGRQVFLGKAVIDATEDQRIVAAATRGAKEQATNKSNDSESAATQAIVAGMPSDAEAWTVAAAIGCGESAGRTAAQLARKSPSWLATQSAGNPATVRVDAPQITELLSGPDLGVRYPVLHQEAVDLPVSEEVDVLVLGGGTSGAPAAIAAARQRARVTLVEMLPGLGGTSSYRVNTYYWGVPWKSHLSEEIDAPISVRPTLDKTGLDKFRFSGENKKASLAELADKAGVKVHARSLAAGAVVERDRVVGAVIESAQGRHVIRARVVIDATGHGDIAAAAGAAFDTGRTRDGFLHEAEHGPLRDALDPEDISKFYLRVPQANLNLNLRESRRIRGDYTVTFDDVLAGRRFPDVVARWRSNYDSHFPHSANQDPRAQDWMAILGLFRKPLWGDIPYRAILPRGLENILVVGKAWSVTHDALIGARMQRDLQHLGEAAGVAAAMACRRRISPRALPIDQLQAELVRLRVLLPEELSEAHLAHSTAPRVDLSATVSRLGTDQCLDAMVELYLAGPPSLPHLLPLLKSENEASRTEAALVLGMLGQAEAAPVLLERLAARDPRTFAFKLPDASSRASVPVYYSAVILLGRLKHARAAAPIRELIQDPEKCPTDLASFAIVALGQLTDRSAIELIKPYLKVAKEVGLRDENMQFESHWGVRTNAARVLAELGDRSGVPVLVELLGADQSRLRNYAQSLLEQISGQSFGKDRRAWEYWCHQPGNLRPSPPVR